MTGMTPHEVRSAVASAAATLPVERRDTFEDRAMSWLSQYSAPSNATVRSVIASVVRDMSVAGGTE